MKTFTLYLILALIFLIPPVFAVNVIINAFNAGELSPLLEGRTDVAKYYSGARTMENFLPKTYGGVNKRPGTMYIADTNDNEEVRLITFEFSTTDAYILEVGNGFIGFFRDAD